MRERLGKVIKEISIKCKNTLHAVKNKAHVYYYELFQATKYNEVTSRLESDITNLKEQVPFMTLPKCTALNQNFSARVLWVP